MCSVNGTNTLMTRTYFGLVEVCAVEVAISGRGDAFLTSLQALPFKRVDTGAGACAFVGAVEAEAL